MTATSPDDSGAVRGDWTALSAATFAGAAIALQIGKSSVTLPLLREEFDATVALLSLYISFISIIAAIFGFGFGLLARRLGVRRAAMTGLACTALASGAGALAGSAETLLAARMLEAVGFALGTAALPVIVQGAAAPAQRSLAMGIWSTWMPAGTALAMIAGYLLLDRGGWRGMFVISAIAPAAAFMLLWWRVPAPGPSRTPPIRPGHVMHREILLLSASFIVFSALSLIFMGFLPTILVDDFAMSPAHAGLAAFGAVLLLLPANVLGGRMLDHGGSPGVLMGVSFVVLALAGLAITAAWLPVPLRIAAVGIFALADGVPPAVIWASVPRLAADPADAPLVSGMFYQGAGIGQVTGPLVAGWIVTQAGSWAGAGRSMFVLALVGLALALLLRRPNRLRAHR